MKYYGIFVIFAALILVAHALPNYPDELIEHEENIKDEEVSLIDDTVNQEAALNFKPIDSDMVHLTRQKRQITCSVFGNGVCNARCRAMRRSGGFCNRRRICVCRR